jgi:hypothetical protein
MKQVVISENIQSAESYLQKVNICKDRIWINAGHSISGTNKNEIILYKISN